MAGLLKKVHKVQIDESGGAVVVLVMIVVLDWAGWPRPTQASPGLPIASQGVSAEGQPEDSVPPPAIVAPFRGCLERVLSVAFSPDGTKVLTGSCDDMAALWDVATGNALRTFLGHARLVTSVAFSPDGTKVLTGSYDKTAKLWDAATGNALRTFQGHTERVSSVAFSADGRKVLTGSWDGTARVWEVQTGQELVQLWYLRGGGWVTITPSGYFEYDGTEKTLLLIGLQDPGTGRLLPAEEVRRYHRPELVRKALSPGM